MVSAKAVGAGAFVLIGAVLFAVALFMIGERRMLFENRFTVYTEFANLGQLGRSTPASLPLAMTPRGVRRVIGGTASR